MAVETPLGKLLLALGEAVKSVEGIHAFSLVDPLPSAARPRNAPSSKGWAQVTLESTDDMVGPVSEGRRPFQARFKVRVWAGGKQSPLAAAELACKAAYAVAPVRVKDPVAQVIEVRISRDDQDPEIAASHLDLEVTAEVRCE